MPRLEIDLDPADHVTADALGKPGQRVFYLHAWQAERVVTVIIEKIQMQSLATGLRKFLEQVAVEFPDLPPAESNYKEEQMRLSPPLDPLFRVGEIGLGFDHDRDLAVIIVREIVLSEMEPDEAAAVRFWCTRAQALNLVLWSEEVVQRGRPTCVQCQQPIEPDGHFCPKKNGYLN